MTTKRHVTVESLFNFFVKLEKLANFDEIKQQYYVVKSGHKLWFDMRALHQYETYCLLGLYMKFHNIEIPVIQSLSDVSNYIGLSDNLVYRCFYSYSTTDFADFPKHIKHVLSVLQEYLQNSNN